MLQDIPFNCIAIDRNGQQAHLTVKEFCLLYFLYSHKGQVFTEEQLYENVWGYNHTLGASNLSSFIRIQRLKIELIPDKSQYIITVWGVGCKFSEQEKPQLYFTTSCGVQLRFYAIDYIWQSTHTFCIQQALIHILFLLVNIQLLAGFVGIRYD